MLPSRDTAPERRGAPLPPIAEPHVAPDEIAALPADLRMRYAAWLRVTGQHGAARRVLDIIEEDSGETATLLDERAALALAAGDAAAVRATFERRLANRPAPSARAAFARALLELGEMEDAASIVAELTANHGELATVRSLAADLALLQGDLATAHNHASAQLSDDETRIAPRLVLARIALLGGDIEEARALLDRALTESDALTAAQAASAAALADFLGQSARAQSLRMRYARLEAQRAAALAAEIAEALRTNTAPSRQ